MNVDFTGQPLDAMFYQNPLPMWIYDIETLAYLEVNQAAESIYGYARAEFLAMTIADIRPEHERRRLHQFTVRHRPDWVDAGIWQHMTKSGETIWVKIVSHAYTFEGRSARFVIALDVSEQKRTEAEISAALDRAKRHTVQLQRVNRLAQRVNIGDSPDTVLQQIVEEARLILGAHQAVVSLTIDANWGQSISAVSFSEKYADYHEYNTPPDGSGIYRLVCETNQPMRLTQAQLESHPAWNNFGSEADKHPPMNGWLAAPLVDREGKNTGLIQMSDKFEGDFDADDEAILTQIAYMASGILENSRLYTALQSAEERVSRLYALSRKLSVLSTRQDVMQTVIDEACALTDAPWGVFAYIPTTAELPAKDAPAQAAPTQEKPIQEKPTQEKPAQLVYASSGLPAGAELPLPGLENRGEIGELVFVRHQSICVEDIRALELYSNSSLADIADRLSLDVRSFLAVPVVSNSGRSLGGLFFAAPTPDMFTRHHQHLAEAVAAPAGVTLEKLVFQAEIEEHAAQLETRVAERTKQLERTNSELEAFTYSVSHDLRAPLRAIDGFSQILVDRHSEGMDERGIHYLHRIRAGTQRMAQLIDDLLELSRVTRKEIERKRVDLSTLAQTTAQELQQLDTKRRVQVEIDDGLIAHGDEHLLSIVVQNLFENAWKFTSKTPNALIRFQRLDLDDGRPAFCVSDNGAGFDMAYADKLFGVFQRLHRAVEFPGTGVGLATVQRIIHRHQGNIWAEGEPNRGARFWFTLESGTNGAESYDT